MPNVVNVRHSLRCLSNLKLQTKNKRFYSLKNWHPGTGKKYLQPTTTTNGVNHLSHRECHVFRITRNEYLTYRQADEVRSEFRIQIVSRDHSSFHILMFCFVTFFLLHSSFSSIHVIVQKLIITQNAVVVIQVIL
jgi:hypothetical protein